jgi:stage II sporulation protein P
VGDEIARQLERAGYQVIHDKTIYDRQYGGAYDRSKIMVERTLKEHPEIEITLDIHRDAIQNDKGVKTRPVAEVEGKRAAQIMMITGVEEGTVTDFPNWAKNLSFAVQLQGQMNADFPGLTRPIFFTARKYNMNLTPYSLLVEVGSDANTLEQAVYAGALFGSALARWMDGHVAAV